MIVYGKELFYSGKNRIFAHSDAEAPLSVFLFHRYLFLRGGEGTTGSPPQLLLRKSSDYSSDLQCFPYNNSKKKHISCPKDSLMERVVRFACSVPEFRRTNKGNIRHKLGDILTLIILGRMSKCVGRAEIIAFGRQNLKRFHSMGILRNGVPSESTLCRVEQGLDDRQLAQRMSEFMDTFRRELRNPGNGPDIICVDGKAMCGTVQENGRNPDIVSAYSPDIGITLATEACQEKSNEIMAVPELLDRLDISGKGITADAMSFQKRIIDKIRKKGGDFVIELKANQRALRYGIEDKLASCTPLQTYKDGPVLAHGRIETRTYHAYDGLELIADKEKWGGNLTVVVFNTESEKKSTGTRTSEQRIYVSSLSADAPCLGNVIRKHWSIESMHWSLDCNFLQDRIKRKTLKAARNLDTLQRIAHALFSLWRGRRKKRSDKVKGNAELRREVSGNFTRLIRFLFQK